MKAIGIIAEYNPFHNGHAYQIAEIKKRTGADFVVAVMSGNFVQRGAPAIVDKYTRTEMALRCGADLVLELPVLWATASAESFAMAGVTLLEKMGCIDGICFGAETDNLSLLSSIADILCKEPNAYKTALSDFLKQGVNFPLARAKAVASFLSASKKTALKDNLLLHIDTENLMQVLQSPNNILALEYLKALMRRNSPIVPLLLKREGAGYHDASLDHFRASATAIRSVFHKNPSSAISQEELSSLKNAIPTPALEIFSSYLAKNPTVHLDDFSSILGYHLLVSTPGALAEIADIGPALSNRFFKLRYQFVSFSAFCEQNKSKEITYTRISRGLLHLLLNITKQDTASFKQLDYIPYLRILGFRKSSSKLLSRLKKTACVPVIAKLADACCTLPKEAFDLLEMDISAAELYETIKAVKAPDYLQNGLPDQMDALAIKHNAPIYQYTGDKKRTILRSEYSRSIVLIP